MLTTGPKIPCLSSILFYLQRRWNVNFGDGTIGTEQRGWLFIHIWLIFPLKSRVSLQNSLEQPRILLPYTPPLFRSNCSIPKVYIPPSLQILRVAPRLQIGCNPDTINDCNCPSVPFRLFHRPNSHGHSLQDQPL